jgi:hypothetical protein
VVEPLKTRLLLAGVASCTCGTKTPDIVYHAPACRFRVIWEAGTRIDDLEAALRFYRDGFVMDSVGDMPIPGSCWMTPTDALLADEGRIAHDALVQPC